MRHLGPEGMDGIAVGDVIAYSFGGSVVIHRVVSIDREGGTLVAKGDANTSAETVPFDRVVGEVVGVSYPLGAVVSVLRSETVMVLAAGACAVILVACVREVLRVLRDEGDE